MEKMKTQVETDRTKAAEQDLAQSQLVQKSADASAENATVAEEAQVQSDQAQNSTEASAGGEAVADKALAQSAETQNSAESASESATIADEAKDQNGATNATQDMMKIPSMGWGGSPFIDVKIMDYYQLAFITAVYGYILYVGSNMIGDGAEQLQHFNSVKGIVGSVVVPILGAVPDSMMVLFSGLGPNAQSQVTTGVGALAGSTVMLLTFPWFVVNMVGSVHVNSKGEADYKGKGKKTEPAGLFDSAVTFDKSLNRNVWAMVITSLSFLIIQIPAFFEDKIGIPIAKQAAYENSWAGVGLVVSMLLFVGYVVMCYIHSNDDKRLLFFKEKIMSKEIGLASCVAQIDEGSDEDKDRLKEVFKFVFVKYDQNKSGSLDKKEFGYMLHDLGEKMVEMESNKKFDAWKRTAKKDTMTLEEFTKWAREYAKNELKIQGSITLKKAVTVPNYEDDDDGEEEDLPEGWNEMSPEDQDCYMLKSSFFNMIAGTAVVLMFSDPAVNVFTEWGVRLGISSFYVSFLLAPFASNASELLVAYGMALKKTSSTVTMSFESLVGAACMNNTLCLGVFFMLIYFKGLAWRFKSETLGILVVEWIMAAIILSGTTQRKFMGIVILSLYPGCLALVYIMQNFFGWD